MNNNFAFIFTVSVALFTALSGLITSAISAYFRYKTTKINCDTMLHRIDNEYNHQNSVKSFDIIYKNKLDAYKNICSHITYMKQNEYS